MIFSRCPSRFRAQKDGFLGRKNRYNRLENYLRELALADSYFRHGANLRLFFHWEKNTKRDRLLVEPIPLAYLVYVSIAIRIPNLNA